MDILIQKYKLEFTVQDIREGDLLPKFVCNGYNGHDLFYDIDGRLSIKNREGKTIDTVTQSMAEFLNIKPNISVHREETIQYFATKEKK